MEISQAIVTFQLHFAAKKNILSDFQSKTLPKIHFPRHLLQSTFDLFRNVRDLC